MIFKTVEGKLIVTAETVDDFEVLLSLKAFKSKEAEENQVGYPVRRRKYQVKRSCDVEGCNVITKGAIGLGIHKSKTHGIPAKKKLLITGLA